jgi:hypothetical protein
MQTKPPPLALGVAQLEGQYLIVMGITKAGGVPAIKD